MPARRKTAAELIRQRAEEARRFLESPEAKAQEEAERLVAAYRAQTQHSCHQTQSSGRARIVRRRAAVAALRGQPI